MINAYGFFNRTGEMDVPLMLELAKILNGLYLEEPDVGLWQEIIATHPSQDNNEGEWWKEEIE